MKTKFTRFSVVVSLFFLPVAASAATAASPVRVVQHEQIAVSSLDWVDLVIERLIAIYRALGGDPAKLNLENTLSGKFGLIAEQYVTYGLPPGMTGPEREALAANVLQAYLLLSAPPPGVVVNADEFIGVLRLIWADLGLPPEELE